MKPPHLSDAFRRQRLEPPAGKVRMVLDTDAYNEIDDQFAVVHALLSPERLGVEAIYAAPFHNQRSAGPAEGMERSYQEILRLLERLDRPAKGLAFRGSTGYLPAPDAPCQSEAVADLIERAAAGDAPLYVVAIGAITNVASAILMRPEIVERIVVVWLGGQPLHWQDAREFNLRQDPAAARVVLDSGVPLVLIPCSGVSSHLLTTLPEIECHVAGRGPVGDYLAGIYRDYFGDHFARSKVIWDIAGIGYLLQADWVPTRLVAAPVLTEAITWRQAAGRHEMRIATFVHRDPIFGDLFTKLAHHAETA